MEQTKSSSVEFEFHGIVVTLWYPYKIRSYNFITKPDMLTLHKQSLSLNVIN